MSDDLSIDKLVIDDSFANYCLQTNEEDRLFWEEYLKNHPSQRQKMEAAMQMVLALHAMLKQEHMQDQEYQRPVLKAIYSKNQVSVLKKIARYATAAAAVFVIVIAGKKMLQTVIPGPNLLPFRASARLITFKTAKGEKRTIVLPDSSRLYLNAGSQLQVDKNFGKENRTVYLTGEVLFDVTRNSSFPFIVHTDKYEIKVLGTLFNVRSYADDSLSETSLIRGKVEISLANNSRKITLLPNQKAVIDYAHHNLSVKADIKGMARPEETVELHSLSYNNKDSAVIETAWTINRLEIVNESFAEMKTKLERWYDVKISFTDPEVANYTFSATFEKEGIREVLEALQNAYSFRYEISGNAITISK